VDVINQPNSIFFVKNVSSVFHSDEFFSVTATVTTVALRRFTCATSQW
jgi:hypothetical protein